MMYLGQITERVYYSVLVTNFIKASVVVNGTKSPAAHNLCRLMLVPLEAAITSYIKQSTLVSSLKHLNSMVHYITAKKKKK